MPSAKRKTKNESLGAEPKKMLLKENASVHNGDSDDVYDGLMAREVMAVLPSRSAVFFGAYKGKERCDCS